MNVTSTLISVTTTPTAPTLPETTRAHVGLGSRVMGGRAQILMNAQMCRTTAILKLIVTINRGLSAVPVDQAGAALESIALVSRNRQSSPNFAEVVNFKLGLHC